MRPEDIDGLTIGGLLDLDTEHRPGDEALVYADRDLRYTYRQFNEKVEECARALMALSLEPGDKIVVREQNVPEWVTLQFATGKIQKYKLREEAIEKFGLEGTTGKESA